MLIAQEHLLFLIHITHHYVHITPHTKSVCRFDSSSLLLAFVLHKLKSCKAWPIMVLLLFGFEASIFFLLQFRYHSSAVQLKDQLRLDDSHTLHKFVYYIIGNITMRVLTFLGLGRLVSSCSYRENHNHIIILMSHINFFLTKVSLCCHTFIVYFLL